MAKKKKQVAKGQTLAESRHLPNRQKRSAFVVRCQRLKNLNYMSMLNFQSGRKVAYNAVIKEYKKQIEEIEENQKILNQMK